MSYNWKYCSFYPNNFGASALRPRYAYTPTEVRIHPDRNETTFKNI